MERGIRYGVGCGIVAMANHSGTSTLFSSGDYWGGKRSQKCGRDFCAEPFFGMDIPRLDSGVGVVVYRTAESLVRN